MLNALYSNAGGDRKISWNSSKLKDIPNEFILKANIILIINEIPKNLGRDLINSRCLNYEFKFNNFEILAIMKAIADTKHPKLSKEERHKIIDYITEYVDETTLNFDLRVQNKIENLYIYDKNSWKDLAKPLLNTKNEKLMLLKNLIKECSDIKEVKNKWIDETGLSIRQYQRYNKKLKNDIKTSK